MKKFNLSLVAVLAMSTFAVAGGDIAPVEEPVVVVPEVVSEGNFYLGLAYGWMSAESTDSYRNLAGAQIDETLLDEDFSEIMLQVGYNFNEYIAVEGRYWFGLETGIDLIDDTANSVLSLDQSVDSWGIYVKPQYPVTEAFNIYALLGYASSEYEVSNSSVAVNPETDLDGFSWGIGAAYNFSESVSVFVDYVSLYDDNNDYNTIYDTTGTLDDTLSTVNFGVTYNF